MEKIKKRKKVIVIISVLALFTFSGLYFLSHKTSLKYNDWLVVGHSYQEVKERYGEFDIKYEHSVAYRINDGNQMIMSSRLPEYYWMVLDDEGIVTRVYVDTKPGG